MKPPPFELTAPTLGLVAEIMRLVGRFEGLSAPQPQLKLRRGSRVSTVLGSLGIEGNTLSIEQATAVFEGKAVVGPKRDILELQNAFQAYELARSFSPYREGHLCKAHGVLMKGLLDDAGHFRSKGVGVFQGGSVAHVAPPAGRVPGLVQALLVWAKTAKALDLLVASAVVHYELEFIHPFSDGNGRMGRLWQHVMLLGRHPIFEWVPVESVIRDRQSEYYRVLGQCDRAGSSTAFIEFSLSTILQALGTFLDEVRPEPQSGAQRLEAMRAVFGTCAFSRKEYLAHFKTVSTATASRDLQQGVAQGVLTKQGDKVLARYRFTGS